MAHSELNGGLLIVTQVVDETDSVLGFFVSWIRRLAESGRPVTVFCWKAGTYSDLPKQVHVIVLPKGGLRRAFRIAVWSFTHRKNFSAVFVHMIPPVAAALGPVWRLLRKRVVLWYTHGSVSRTLKYSEWFVHTILTASDESCRINSRKKVVVGHGIDLEIFKPGDRAREPLLICVGRISRRKNQRAFIELCEQIHRAQPKLIFRGMIIGVPRTEEDFVYFEELKKMVLEAHLESIVVFCGALIGEALLYAYQTAALFMSASETGSLDKVVLEALACETPVLATGTVYASWPGVCVSRLDSSAVATTLKYLNAPINVPAGREAVRERADLRHLIRQIESALFA